MTCVATTRLPLADRRKQSPAVCFCKPPIPENSTQDDSPSRPSSADTGYHMAFPVVSVTFSLFLKRISLPHSISVHLPCRFTKRRVPKSRIVNRVGKQKQRTMNEEFDRITPDNLENFLNYHMEKPLPKDWFIPFEGVGYQVCVEDKWLHILNTPEIAQWVQRGFTPVPYIPKKIAYVQVCTPLTISSKFSGCAMALFHFNSESNKQYVCHISTGGDEKGLIDEFKGKENEGKITIDAYFKPADIIDSIPTEYINFAINTSNDIFGIITEGGTCYSVVIRRKYDDKLNEDKRFVFAWARWEKDDTTPTFVHISTDNLK